MKLLDVEFLSGTIGLVSLCYEVLGSDKVSAGLWMDPVTLLGVTQEDVNTILELCQERNVKIGSRIIREFKA